MFGHGNFSHSLIRKYMIMFGNMFNDITVVKIGVEKNNKKIKKTVKIPIKYGPKAKWLAKARAKHDSKDPSTSISIPVMAFEITGLSFDSSRTLNKNKMFMNSTTGQSGVDTHFSPVPYNIDFSLYGMFDKTSEASQVLEQINPFFRPHWTNTIKLVDGFDNTYDIATVLNDTTMEDEYEGDFTTRRSLTYTWNFTVKGFLIGPKTHKGVITRVVVDAAFDEKKSGHRERDTLVPGLTSDGKPTTDLTRTVVASEISANSDFAFIHTNEDIFEIGEDNG